METETDRRWRRRPPGRERHRHRRNSGRDAPEHDGPVHGRVRGPRPRRLLRRLPRRARRQPRHPPARDHGVHRSVRLRQVDRPAVLRPDERPDRDRAGRGHDPLPRRRPVRRPTSTRSRCGAASAWCSRSRTRSRSRSTTTSRSVRASTASRRRSSSTTSSSSSLRAGGAVGRGQGPPEGVGARPVGRSAAAAVHRPLRSPSSPT